MRPTPLAATVAAPLDAQLMCQEQQPSLINLLDPEILPYAFNVSTIDTSSRAMLR